MPISRHKQFQTKLTKVVKPFILSGFETDREDVREVIRDTLYGSNETQRFLSPFTRRDEVFARRLFLEFDEIVSSYQCLRDIEIYIRRFPYRDTGLSDLRYLKYHIENHLNEVYIF